MNKSFVDIGELGWAIHLAAHAHWLKANTNSKIQIITSLDRFCLYERFVDDIQPIPKTYYEAFPDREPCCFGLFGVPHDKLRQFFLPYVKTGYEIPVDFILTCHKFFKGREKYAPYPYKKVIKGRQEILVFPRCRNEGHMAKRNLPEQFYVDLIDRLCLEFPSITIRTVGTEQGAYRIKHDADNFIDWIGQSKDLQDVIDLCQVAIATVGSQSAPPKLALLQGVPTYMIGHEKERHTVKENWMGTKAGYWPIGADGYSGFVSRECIDDVVLFVKNILK